MREIVSSVEMPISILLLLAENGYVAYHNETVLNVFKNTGGF